MKYIIMECHTSYAVLLDERPFLEGGEPSV